LGRIEQDNLIAGPRFPVAFKGVSLAPGQGLMKRGTVLGVVKNTGLALAVNSANSDDENTGTYGSHVPDSILAEEVDTGMGDAVSAVAYSAGYFVRGALIFGGADTWQTHELEMRKLNMHLSASIDEEGAIH
jgi:hypothetical protein